MWYRVELAKDGGIKGVKVVEARDAETSRVCYVDAPSPEKAVIKARAWYAASLPTNRARFLKESRKRARLARLAFWRDALALFDLDSDQFRAWLEKRVERYT